MSLNRKIAYVNLTRRKVKTGSISHEMRKRFLGGRSLGAYLLYNHIEPGVDSFSPDNAVVISAGPLAGTPGSASCPLSLCTKSPTGGYCHYSGSTLLTAEMRWAGFDHVVITGKAAKPVYLWLHDGKITIKDASGLTGKTISETQQAIREELRDRNTRILAIGPAGEKLVRFAGVFSGPGETDSGAGIGAVFGSKNLKAVAVRGTMPISLAHPKETLEYSYPLVPPVQPQAAGEGNISNEEPDGYTALLAALRDERIDDRYGLGPVETADLLAWVIDLSEQYLITSDDTDNLDISPDNSKAVLAMVGKIAVKQGFGETLAEGIFKAAEKVGNGSENRISRIGNHIVSPEQDLTPVLALHFATSAENSDYAAVASMLTADMLAAPAFEQAAWFQNLSMAAESLGTTRYPNAVAGLTDACYEDWAKNCSLVTGLEMTPDAIRTAAERAVTLERLFNLGEGFQGNTIPMSEHIYSRLRSGDSAITPETFGAMLHEYYRYRGWDENGIPTRETLQKLGLDKEPSHQL
jgi:aldehyde:ferredoxin oxidoreductase